MDYGQVAVNKPLTVNDWYFDSLRTLTDMYQANGIQTIKFNNLPYYGNMSLSTDGTYGDMDTLQKDFEKAGYHDVIGMTNAKLCETKDNYHILNIYNENIYDAYATKHLGEWATFANTDKGVFTSLFSQQDHEPYAVKDAFGHYYNAGSHSSFLRAQWDTIHDVQGFFDRLKSETFYNQQGQPEGNVYDHTLILINSDHGFYIHNQAQVPDYAKLVTWFKTQNLLTPDQANQLIHFDHYQYNPVIMFKPFKYDNQGNITHNQTQFSFNTDQLVCLSDLSVIIQNYLNEFNRVKTGSFFINDQLLNQKVQNQTIVKMVKEGQLINPLDPTQNSLTNHIQNNHHFYIFDPFDWRYKA